MRLLQVIPSVDPRTGGPAEGANQQTQQLQSRGVDVHTVCFDKPEVIVSQAMNAATHTFLGPTFLKYGYSRSAAKWFDENVKRYDCIIVRGIWQYHCLVAAKACQRHNIPYYVYAHGMLDPWFGRNYPLKHLKKLIYWRLLEAKNLEKARGVLFTTQQEMILARQAFTPYCVREVMVGYGIVGRQGEGISTYRGRRLEDRFPQLRGKRIVLFVSRLHRKKGCDLLVRAFSRIAETDQRLRLVIAGPEDGTSVSSLSALAFGCGVFEKVFFPGMLNRDEKYEAYTMAEVFVLPSHQENFGIVLAEALSCSLPVLTTYQVNIWRTILEEGAGLVDDDDLAGIISLLDRWMRLSASERRSMRRKALVCFEKNFDISASTNNVLELLNAA